MDNKETNAVQHFLSSRWRLRLLMVFGLVVIVSAQYVYIFGTQESDLVLRVAYEVEACHLNQHESEFDSDDLQKLKVVMNELDFNLDFPQSVQRKKFKIVGAGYCVIQGQIAAQLHLFDQQQQRAALYATKLNDELVSLHNKQQQRGDLMIRNWQEDGVFYSLVQSM